MARPTSSIYQWCTTLANRIAPSAGAKLLGFAAGDPVPAGVHNDIMGFLSDWIAWLGPRSTSLLLNAPNFLPWASLGVSGSVVTITPDIAGTVTLAFGTGDTGFAGFVLPIEGGRLTGVTVNVDAIDVTTGGAGQVTVDVVFRGTNGTTYATYSGPITAIGDTVIPVVGASVATATRDALLFIEVQPGTETAHFVTIDSITLSFDP